MEDNGLQVPEIIDRYAVQGVLGQGGMAIVYRVRHIHLGTFHALKILTLASRSIRERLLQEGRIQATLRHPNIVSVTDVVVVDGAPGLVLELIDGPSLEALLSQHRLTIEQVDALAQGILAGVDHAHRNGLIHRDLKPANILLAVTDAGLVPKVTDFGLAKLFAGEGGPALGRTRSGTTMGTPAYMAPEQVRDSKGVDKRADVFSLGAILYEMVGGVRAFDGEDIVHIFNALTTGTYVPIKERAPDLPERMVAAIAGALQVDRDKRIPDVETLLATWRGDVPRAAAPVAKSSGPWSESVMASARSFGSVGAVATGDAATKDATWAATPPGVQRQQQSPDSNVLAKAPIGPVRIAPATIGPASVAASDVSASMAADSIGPKSLETPPAASPGKVIAKSRWLLPVVGAVAIATAGGTALFLAVVVLGVGYQGLAAPEPAPLVLPIAPVVTAPPPTVAVAAPEPATPPVTVSPAVTQPPPAPDPLPADSTPAPAPKAPTTKTTKPVPARPTDVATAPPVEPAATGPGGLFINSVPYSEISLDGTALGPTSWKGDVPAGAHTLILATPDGKRIEKSITVHAGPGNRFCWDFDLGAQCPQ